MPARKRAASAPKDEPEQEPLAPATDADTEPNEAQAADAADETQAGTDQDADGGEAERSDVQTADQPCPECLPNGWPEGAFSVGCTHGTYLRKQD